VKKEKGEAAFESVDEVLASQIVRNARNHSEDEFNDDLEAPALESSSVPQENEFEPPVKKNPLLGIVLAVCAAAAFIIIPLFFLSGKKGRCRR
jgi:hypothetical protein